MLLDKLKEIYRKYGNKAVYLPLFLAFFALNFIGGLGMSYPATDPNELSVIAVAQFFAGKSWAGVMCSVDYYYGFLQGLIYTPAMFLSTPSLQYGGVLFINAVLISFVPVIAYSLACRMKVNRLWKMLLTAFIAGGYCCYYAHSKFAWTETVSILMPWLMILCTFRCGESKSRASRVMRSVLLGLICGLSLAAHTRLIAVISALIVALIFERILFGKKLVNPLAFLIAFFLSATLVTYVSYVLQESLWCRTDPASLRNTLAEFFANFGSNISSDDGVLRLTQTLAGQFYYFVTSTWGVGAVMLCLGAAVISTCIKHKKKNESQSYDTELAVFAVFTAFTILFTIIFSTLYRFSSDGFYTYQDTVMFGRFLDGVIPFALAFVLIMLFTHSVSLNKVLGAVAVLGVIYFAFFFTAMPTILECDATRISPVLALYPLRVGAQSVELLTAESFFLTMSMTFCVMGFFIVVISSSKKYRSTLISLFIAGLTVYSLIFMSNVYLPICREESIQKNADVVKLSESVFDQVGAPAVTALNLSRHEALMLQFLNKNITVRVTYSIENVPENSFLATHTNTDVSALENSSSSQFLLVAESGNLRLYAYGERALAYLQSQDVDESADENEPLITEKPAASDTTPATSETTPPTTTAPVTSSTTERTPAVSTYTTPAVITTPVEDIDDDFEWAVIE